MKVLMLGNSFTYFHDMPRLLAVMLGEEVQANTRGGAYLSEQMNEADELGANAMRALKSEKWDYVVLQEQSIAPAIRREEYLQSVRKLCALIAENGAKPVIYASWAYKEGSEKLSGTGFSYEEMLGRLHDACHEAARANDALVADVGMAFDAARGIVNLYEDDDYHPSAAGSMLAAHVIAETIENNWKDKQ